MNIRVLCGFFVLVHTLVLVLYGWSWALAVHPMLLR
jgi:hypothetical protein